MNYRIVYDDEFYHHGIKGQRWGVRRFQNEDGSNIFRGLIEVMTVNYKIVYDDELQHHGIKGQRWGVRRYQNDDGTLTSAGRKRYGADRYDSKGNLTEVGVKRFKLKDGKAVGADEMSKRTAKSVIKADVDYFRFVPAVSRQGIPESRQPHVEVQVQEADRRLSRSKSGQRFLHDQYSKKMNSPYTKKEKVRADALTLDAKIKSGETIVRSTLTKSQQKTLSYAEKERRRRNAARVVDTTLALGIGTFSALAIYGFRN